MLKFEIQHSEPLVIDYEYCVIDYTILKIFCHKLWLLRFEIQRSKTFVIKYMPMVINYYFVKKL